MANRWLMNVAGAGRAARVVGGSGRGLAVVGSSGRGLAVVGLGVAMVGCAAPKVDVSKIQRPERSAKLNAYDVFVGSWTWEAKMLNACGEGEKWTGTAEWEWGMDKRVLSGHMLSKSGKTEFESNGVWTWNANRGYQWGMINNWGYIQTGLASYDEADRCWTMNYSSIGLDGTPSYGRYQMHVRDGDTLDWSCVEWADALHLAKKMEMTGTYKRKK